MGVMTRHGEMCSYGTEDIASWVIEADNDPDVSSIVLEIHSPGGDVDGIELFSHVVKNAQKPIVAYVTGMAASGAYWIASQCREIILESSVTSEVGSIGVLSMHQDSSEYYKKEGHKITIIRSEGSEDKSLYNEVEPLSKELIAQIQAEMKPVRDLFISTVKNGRSKVSDDVFSGKMFSGKSAIKNGMADRIGFLGDAVNRADFLARKQA
jgi:protease-4